MNEDLTRYVEVQQLRDLGITAEDERIEKAIGEEVVDALEDDELKEMVAVQDAGDDDALAEWIQAHVEEYEQIVQDNIDIVLGDVAESSEKL